MRIKTKILWTLLGMPLLGALVGALAVNRQHAAAMAGVTKEAEDVARVVGFLLISDTNKLSAASVQETVVKLHRTQGRDVVLMDSNQVILADPVPSQIGKIFTEDPSDEVGATIKDRQVRTFVEVSQDYPAGIKQIVVPVEGESGQVIGAVVLEFAPFYNELIQLTESTIRQVVLAGLGSVAIALLIAFYMGRSIAGPLQQLTNVATGFASGWTDLPMPPPRKDEIGELATAFNDMVQKRQQAEDELRRLRDELEVRVGERTTELVKANETLQAENTERKRAEETLRESEEKFHQLADNITDAFWIRSPDMRVVHYVSPAYERTWGRSTQSLYANPHQWADAILPEDRERVLAMFATLTGAAPSISIEYRIARPDGEVRCVHVRGFQVRDAAGELIRLTGIVTDITESKRANAQRERLADIVEASPDFIGFADPKTTQIQYINKHGRRMCGIGEDEDVGNLKISDVHPAWMNNRFAEVMPAAIRDGLWEGEGAFLHRNGREIPVVMALMARKAANGEVDVFYTISRDITERKLSEAALEKAHKELLETSRQAGMAEVATNVLHNVGNVLNSVNVASSCLADSLRKSKAADLSKVVTMLREHEGDLGAFLTSDPTGKQLPDYLAQLAEHLAGEQSVALDELAGLQKNIEHIKGILAMQQSFGQVSGVMETLQVTELVDEALRMNPPGLFRRDIQVIKEFEKVPLIMVEKHKVLQIIVNLVRNAKQACDSPSGAEKRLTLRVTKGDDRVRIAIRDNGVGILPENLARIFGHGFTTKKDGQGFGLHSGALAAKEMGGSLSVHSNGPGTGATFTLELPLQLLGGANGSNLHP